MRLLAGRLSLLDVDDVEALAGKALRDGLAASRAVLTPADDEDAKAYLIATIWEASLTYDPSRSVSFSTFGYRRARLRLVDWFRARFWDTRTPKPELPLSLDEALAKYDADLEGSARSQHDRLARHLGAGSLDPSETRAPDLCWVLATGSSGSGGADEPPGRPPHAEAA